MRIFRSIFTSSKNLFVDLSRESHPQIMDILEERILAALCKKLPPVLSNERHKGQSGRIGVIGGSFEYTGAPYFTAISALKAGADLTHVFCSRDAGSVIKSYSPELIVHPLLDNQQTAQNAIQWIEKLHVVVIGPGLGRKQETFEAVTVLLNECRRLKKPLVIDADGLFFITKESHVLENYPAEVILTPNVVEFAPLFNTNDLKAHIAHRFGKKITVVRKGFEDEIFDSVKKSKCTVKGSGRRCGGQGDILAGSLATFFCWAVNQVNIDENLRVMVACYAACQLTRECNFRAYKLHGRSMTCTDMIAQIGGVFNDTFESK